MYSLGKTLDQWRPRPPGALGSVLLCLAALAGISIMTRQVLELGMAFPWRVLAAFALGSALMLALAHRHLRPGPFGAANRVTLARGALIALLVGLLGERAAEPAVAGLAIAVALLALALDGVDGQLARRQGNASAFGARFDMETDALMILVLAALVWQADKAGSWILLAGLMRYGFVAAAAVMPWLRRPLPESRRRQVVFVLLALTLIGCLVPALAPPWSGLLALGGLALIGGSFAADVAWLARRGARSAGPAP